MRPLTYGDVSLAAMAIRDLSADVSRIEMLRFLNHAHAADLFRKRTGRAHPLWGDGSLAAVVLKHAPRKTEPFLGDPQYLGALSIVIECLLEWRAR
ncbi:MAG: hypothetical protein WBC95_01295 [Albidovulum sp.]